MKADNNSSGSLGAREAIRLAVLASLGSLALVVGSFAVASADGGGVGPGGGGSQSGTGDRYERAWDNFSSKDRKWARSVGYCESGNDPDRHADAGGDRYHGAFMFLIESWKNSPMSPGGDPHQFSWKTQAVVAVKLKHEMGTRPWPECG
ncbi:MAG: Transglycosylase-like domain [Solirubrobacterales bacterium]|jgi:hypothetical protein|nr:Transglycosylase-like domain [Solirubrobacterales bacterium]